MAKQMKNEKKKANPILWFLFAIVIPIIIAITLTIVVFSIAGVNVVDWVKEKTNHVPVLSSFVTTEEEKNRQLEEDQFQSKIAGKDEEISKLKQEIQDLESTVEQLEHEAAKGKRNTDNMNVSPDSENMEEDSNPVKTVSSSFKDMDSEQAALIMERLEKKTAVKILGEVSNKVRGKILEAMDPEKAAELTQLLINSED